MSALFFVAEAIAILNSGESWLQQSRQHILTYRTNIESISMDINASSYWWSITSYF
jgi:hypothetical protein